MSKKSNVFSQGQGGANFEFRVQTAFLITMLLECRFPIELPEGKIDFIKFQANGIGYDYLTDDMYVDYLGIDGKHYKLLFQIKHNISFTPNNNFFLKVINDAWKDFNSKNFNPNFDKIVIIKGNLSSREYNHLLTILDWARYKISALDFFNEVNSIAAKKSFIKIFSTAIQKANEGLKITKEELWKFLKCFSILSYDFNLDNGKDKSHFLNLIENSIPHNLNLAPQDIWNRFFEFVSKADSKGASINLSNIPQNLKDCLKTENGLSFYVHHKDSLPLSFDYFYRHNKIVKSWLI